MDHSVRQAKNLTKLEVIFSQLLTHRNAFFIIKKIYINVYKKLPVDLPLLFTSPETPFSLYETPFLSYPEWPFPTVAASAGPAGRLTGYPGSKLPGPYGDGLYR